MEQGIENMKDYQTCILNHEEHGDMTIEYRSKRAKKKKPIIDIELTDKPLWAASV